MKQPKSTKPRKEQSTASVPLFPELKMSEVSGLRIEAILDEDETYAFDGLVPAESTANDLRKLFADEIACEELDGQRKTPGRLELQVTAVHVRGKERKPYDVTTRDLLLTASGDVDPPVVRTDGSVAVTVEQTTPPIVPELQPPPRSGPRTKRAPREHVVATADAQILPGDVGGERALEHLVQRELRQFMSTQSHENQRALADGTRLMVSAVADGVRQMFKHAENRDERISELKTQVAELKQQRAEDRAEYHSRTGDLEEELHTAKRAHRREVAKLETEIDELKEELAEAEKKAQKIASDVKSMVWGLAQQFGPSVVQGLLDKFGVKMPDAAAAAANGAAA